MREIGRLGLAGGTDWDFLWARLNWVNFTFIAVDFENDKLFGNYELRLGLLGFWAVLTWHYRDTEFADRLARQVDEMRASLGVDE